MESRASEAQARKVLAANDKGSYTAPAPNLYPHQWLWDSCFVAIGLAHYQPRRAMIEISSLLDAQWQNGMIPHMIFAAKTPYWIGHRFWRSWRSSAAPQHIGTSGITQPPLVAIAALAVADKLTPGERVVWLRQVYPSLLAYHRWLYRERDPHNTGLVVLIHPWESGLDNSPVWMEVLKRIPNPLWLGTFFRLKLDKLINGFRSDVHSVLMHQRLSEVEAVRLLHRAILLRQQNYDSYLILQKNHLLVEDLTFNSLLITANRALFDIATLINEELPSDLNLRTQKTEQALEELWDETSGQYYSRNFRTQKLVKTPTIATFMPLYSGTISPERAQRLRSLLTNPTAYWPLYPVPSASLSSDYFDQHRFWQGPTWINTNWFIIKGLEHYNFAAEAIHLRQTTLGLIEKTGFREYYSPLTGEGLGASDFSWTAALYIELINSKVGPSLTRS